MPTLEAAAPSAESAWVVAVVVPSAPMVSPPVMSSAPRASARVSTVASRIATEPATEILPWPAPAVEVAPRVEALVALTVAAPP